MNDWLAYGLLFLLSPVVLVLTAYVVHCWAMLLLWPWCFVIDLFTGTRLAARLSRLLP